MGEKLVVSTRLVVVEKIEACSVGLQSYPLLIGFAIRMDLGDRRLKPEKGFRKSFH